MAYLRGDRAAALRSLCSLRLLLCRPVTELDLLQAAPSGERVRLWPAMRGLLASATLMGDWQSHGQDSETSLPLSC